MSGRGASHPCIDDDHHDDTAATGSRHFATAPEPTIQAHAAQGPRRTRRREDLGGVEPCADADVLRRPPLLRLPPSARHTIRLLDLPPHHGEWSRVGSRPPAPEATRAASLAAREGVAAPRPQGRCRVRRVVCLCCLVRRLRAPLCGCLLAAACRIPSSAQASQIAKGVSACLCVFVCLCVSASSLRCLHCLSSSASRSARSLCPAAAPALGEIELDPAAPGHAVGLARLGAEAERRRA